MACSLQDNAYPLINFQGRNPSNLWLAFWEKRWPHKLILNLTDLYIKPSSTPNWAKISAKNRHAQDVLHLFTHQKKCICAHVLSMRLLGKPEIYIRMIIAHFYRISMYSRVHISWNKAFFKILKKPSIVQKEKLPHLKAFSLLHW